MIWVVFWVERRYNGQTFYRYSQFATEVAAEEFAIDIYDHLCDCQVLCLCDEFVRAYGVPSHMAGSTCIMWKDFPCS